MQVSTAIYCPWPIAGWPIGTESGSLQFGCERLYANCLMPNKLDA